MPCASAGRPASWRLPRAISSSSVERSGWKAAQKSSPAPGVEADLAGRLAVEEAADRARRRVRGSGSSCAPGRSSREPLAVSLDVEHGAEGDALARRGRAVGRS